MFGKNRIKSGRSKVKSDTDLPRQIWHLTSCGAIVMSV